MDFVKVHDVLNLNLKTFANIPLSSHTVHEIKEAVRRDNKQRFTLLEENGEILIRANQGHSTTIVEIERLLKPILSFEKVSVCVHGTYRKNWDSILESGLKCMTRLHVHFASGLPTDGEVISGMRRDVNILIFLDIRNALAEGIKFYISDNKVILTEGFDGVVSVNVAASAKTLDEGQTKWFGRKAVNYLLITVTGGVALSALDDLIIYQSCSSKAMEKASKDPAIREALGEPVLKGPWYNAQLGVAHKRQSVSCKFPVYGPKGTGVLSVKAVRDGDDSWMSYFISRNWDILIMDALLHIPENEEKKQTIRITIPEPACTSPACSGPSCSTQESQSLEKK
ncbi:hypothetical protein ACLB2K_010832 [Fragaria x ananassa]